MQQLQLPGLGDVKFVNEEHKFARTSRDFNNYSDLDDDADSYVRIHEYDLKMLIDNVNCLKYIAENQLSWNIGNSLNWVYDPKGNKAYFDKEMKEPVPLDDYDKFYSELSGRTVASLFKRLARMITSCSVEELNVKKDTSMKKLFDRLSKRTEFVWKLHNQLIQKKKRENKKVT